MEENEDTNKEEWKSPEDDSSEPYPSPDDIAVMPTDKEIEIDFDDQLINNKMLIPSDKPIKDIIEEKPKRRTFSETWNDVDELCPSCGKVFKPAEGLNRQNLKRLISFQTDPQSLTIFFLLIMCGLFAFSTYSYMTAPTNCSTNVTDILINVNDGVYAIPVFNMSPCGINITCNVTEINVNLSDFVIEEADKT